MNETLRTINSLRSIHGNFSEKEIGKENLQIILDSSIQAATGGCLQSYSIICIDDKDLMEKVCQYRGSRVLIYLVDVNRHTACGDYLGTKFPAPNTGFFMMAMADALLAAQNAVIAAKSLGIDSLINTGIHRTNQEETFQLLNLPEKYCFPAIAVVLGYPAEEPDFKKGRLKGAGIIHSNRYTEPDEKEIDEIIKKYDNQEIHLALNDSWKKKGYKHYLEHVYSDWFSEPEESEEEQLFAYLKKSGFLEG